MELLIGCGARRDKQFVPPELSMDWVDLITLDVNAAHKPNVVWDLNEHPLPFDDDTFDEVHAYEVLEHLGRQGDYEAFFQDFTELWRILKPGGWLVGTSPNHDSKWLWGDPGHTRLICEQSLVFLDQTEYTRQVGKTPLTDYRFCYKADFEPRYGIVDEPTRTFCYALQAIKPSRITTA